MLHKNAFKCVIFLFFQIEPTMVRRAEMRLRDHDYVNVV